MSFQNLVILVIFTVFVISFSSSAYAACASGHSCSLVTSGNTMCFNNNPYDCQWMGGLTYCYVQNATCASDKPCYDPYGLEGAHCHCNDGAKACSSSTVKKVCSNNTWTSTTCATGYACSNGDCVLNCSVGSWTGNYRCSSDTASVEGEYYTSTCGKAWQVSTSCSSSQYCSSNSCISKKSDGSSCSPSGTFMRACSYGYCNSLGKCGANPVCTSGATRCASDTVKETCSSLGQWGAQQSIAYCYFNGTSAVQVQCMQNSHCSTGQTCDLSTHTCKSACTQGTPTGNKRCGANLATVELEYTNADCSKYWATSKTCFTDPTTALQYCNNSVFGGVDCSIRLGEGSSCSPAASSTMMCAAGVCTSTSTCGCILNQKKCASTAVAQTCNSLGTWDGTTCSPGYACSSGNCVATSPYITNYALSPSPTNVFQGASFTITYTIANPTSSSLTGTLGASIFRQGDTANTEYTDSSGDKAVTITPGTGTYSRTFKVPSNAPAGTYRISLALWKTAFTERWSPNYDPSGYPITVTLPCTLTSAAWSKSSATQWESVIMTANGSGCDGKEVKLSIWEDDGILVDDFVVDLYSTFSSGIATYTWSVPYVEDQVGGSEYYFEASIDGQKKSSGTVKVSMGDVTDKTFESLGTILGTNSVTIITYDNPSGKALEYINSLKSQVATKTGVPPKVVSSSQLNTTGTCWDYANYNSTMIIIGTSANNKAVDCIDANTRANKVAETQLSLVNNPWANGKYVIVVQGSDSYYDAIATLKIMVEKGTSTRMTLSDNVVGCLWTGDMTLGSEIACNVIPVVELIPDVRDSYNCAKASLMSLNSESNTDYLGKIVCLVVYGAAAYDIYGYGTTVVAAIFATPVGGAAQGGAYKLTDAGVASFKIAIKSAASALSSKAIQDAYTTCKIIPGCGRLVFKATNAFASADASTAKGILNVLSSGNKVAAENALKFIGDNKDVIKSIESSGKMTKEGIIEAIGALFKAEAETGIPVKVSAEVLADQVYLTNLLKISSNGQYGAKIKNVASSIGLKGGEISEINFVKQLPSGAGGLGAYDAATKKLYLRMQNPSLSITDDEFGAMVLNGVLPHEMTHGLFASITTSGPVSDAAEEFASDAILRIKLSSTDLPLYKAAESKYLSIYNYGADFADAASGGIDVERVVVADTAEWYAEASEYGLTSVKQSIKQGFYDNYLKVKYPAATTAQLDAEFVKFEKYSADIKTAGNSYASAGNWVLPTEWVPAIVPDACSPAVCPAGYTDNGINCTSGACTRTCKGLGSCAPAACASSYTDGGITCTSTSCKRTCLSYNNCTPATCPSGYTSKGVTCASGNCIRACSTTAKCGTIWALLSSTSQSFTDANKDYAEKYFSSASYAGNSCYKAYYSASSLWSGANNGSKSVIYNWALGDTTNGLNWTGSGSFTSTSGSYGTSTKIVLFSPKTVACSSSYASCKVTNGSNITFNPKASIKLNYIAKSITEIAKLVVYRAPWTDSLDSNRVCAMTSSVGSTISCARQNETISQTCEIEIGPVIPPVTDPTIPSSSSDSWVPPVDDWGTGSPVGGDGIGGSVGGTIISGTSGGSSSGTISVGGSGGTGTTVRTIIIVGGSGGS